MVGFAPTVVRTRYIYGLRTIFSLRFNMSSHNAMSENIVVDVLRTSVILSCSHFGPRIRNGYLAQLSPIAAQSSLASVWCKIHLLSKNKFHLYCCVYITTTSDVSREYLYNWIVNYILIYSNIHTFCWPTVSRQIYLTDVTVQLTIQSEFWLRRSHLKWRNATKLRRYYSCITRKHTNK